MEQIKNVYICKCLYMYIQIFYLLLDSYKWIKSIKFDIILLLTYIYIILFLLNLIYKCHF